MPFIEYGRDFLGDQGIIACVCVCVCSQRTWRVVLGDHNLNTTEGKEQIMTVNKVYIHNLWNSNSVAAGYGTHL